MSRVWGYNGRNELTLSERYDTFDSNEPSNPSNNVPGLDREYVYDPIGNRDSSKTGTDPNTAYTTNNLNQYTATTDPNESFSYDADGNLTQDGTYHYTWDAENRLTCVQSGDPNSPGSGDKKVEFVYDYMGRRIEKKVSTHNGSSWSVTYTRRFVWSDWLLVLELDATDPNDVTVLRKYTWGLDLGGTGVSPVIDSAGGIGGLLAAYDADTSKDYLYFHDANGNVGQLIDRSDGSIAAKYEYDAYGNNLLDPNDSQESGPYADDNPFRFSTKYWDDETGLGYWGYRYYSPRLGRFVRRDPIGEDGGLNVYGYVRNIPSTAVDPVGLRFTGGSTGKSSRLWWFGGTSGRGQQPVGSIQTEVPPEFIAEGCCCKVKAGTGYAIVERTYDSVLPGDQGVSTKYFRGKRVFVSATLAAHLDAHEQGHVDASRKIHNKTIAVAEERVDAYTQNSLCCCKQDACAVLRQYIAWNHWTAEFKRLDTAVNKGNGLFHAWETKQGGGPRWGPLPGETIGGIAYDVVYRSRAENPNDNYTLPNYSAYQPPDPTVPDIPRFSDCYSKLGGTWAGTGGSW